MVENGEVYKAQDYINASSANRKSLNLHQRINNSITLKNNNRVYCISLIFWFLMSVTLVGQTDTSHQAVYLMAGTRLHYGFIIAHTHQIKKLATSNPFGIQADLSWQLNTEKAYKLCNCYPRPGLSLNYWDFMNNKILGKGISISGFAEAHFINNKKISLAVRPGLGLAYLSKPHDSVTNPDNLAYSSKIGYSVLLNLTFNYKLNKKWIFNSSLNYNHISNGGVKLPNKGLNFPTVSFGIDHSFSPLNFKIIKRENKIDYINNNQWLLSLYLGFKGIIYDDKTYFVYGIIGKYLYQLGRVSYITGGGDFSVDKSKITIAKNSNNLSKDAQYVISMHGGYEHKFARFRTTFDLGLYLRNPDQSRDLLYQRYGLKYLIHNIFIGINLKTHRHYAEYFDIRAGLIF